MTEGADILRQLLTKARSRIASLRDQINVRADPAEIEQASLRLAFGLLVLGCFAIYAFNDGRVDDVETKVLIAILLYCAAGVAILARIVWANNVSVYRRYLGIVVDNLGITYFMAMMGEAGTLMFGLYLFVIFGNGYRFGPRYLHVCQFLSLAGFSVVLLSDSHWASVRSVGIACFLAILVLPLYVRLLSQRISESKKRADEANQAKGRFLANVSHEMRTPLNGVIAMADVLRETNLNESQREIVDTLGTSAHLLLAQIEDVLDMAKIEAGRVQIEQQPFDLRNLITSTVKVVVPQARYKGLEVNAEIAPEAARWFAGDSHHLRQVLSNLLANAVKFTERGHIVLRVRLTDIRSPMPRVRFEVEDTGIGIAADKQARIFEPFSQADDSITRVYGGTGLGTAIARQLVTLMEGQIGLTSTLGVGTLFWFEIPLPYAEPRGIDLTEEVAATARFSSTAAALAAQQPAKVTKIRGARVLVAEDNATNQRVTQLILESGGHQATIVDNGEQALDALERGSFDLALFDLSMPVVSGLEALKLYRFTTARPIPILILSANVTTEIIAECQSAGCAEFLPKPIRPTSLLEAIDRHLAETAQEMRAFIPPPPRAEERPSLTVVDTPVLDQSVLADLGRLSKDPTFVERLLRGFRTDTERLVQMIGEGFATRRYEQIKDAAHALKGGAGSVGASQLVQLALRLEKASYETLRIRAAAWMEELSHASSAALAALEGHLEERRRQSSQE